MILGSEFMDLVKIDETLDDLQIKDIRIIQKKQGFRFGVDAVLLANYAKVKRNQTVIDLCSGTGIVPFIIEGKKEPKSIVGIEIQEDMVEMANRTVLYNEFQGKIKFINEDLKNVEVLKKMERVDVITVNPPYKLKNSGIVNEFDKNAIARHEICCNLEDVIKAARILLKDNGSFFMVHRPERLADILCLMRKYKIEPKSIKLVYPNTKKPPNIVLIEGKRDGGEFLKWENSLYIHKDNGDYTEELNEIYGR